MNILKRSKLFLPLVIMLVMLAAFALPAPAFAEEGETPLVEPPAAESQGGISTGEPADEPVNRIPENGHEPQAPDEDPVIVRVEEPAAPVEETPGEEAPVVEAPAAVAPQEEAPAETGTPEPVVSAQESGEGQVSAQYNTSLLNNVYFYNAANEAQWYADINGAVAGFVGAGGKGMIYVSNQVEYGDALVVGPTLNLTGIVFLDYVATEATKYGAADFDYYNSANWAQIKNNVTIDDMPNFTLAGFKIAVNNGNPAVKIDNDNGATGTLTLSYLDISNGGSGAGLQINDQTGTINITAVNATSVSGRGAYIGSDSAIAGKLNITNSGFNHNGGIGLEVHITGQTTLTGVSSSNNADLGVEFDGAGVIIKNSVFSNNNAHGFYYYSRGAGDFSVENSQFNNNADIGLTAGNFSTESLVDFVRGNITLKNVRADNNGTTGANLDTCGWNGTSCQNSAAGNITISNSNFANNGHNTQGYGLYVLAKGNIVLTSVWAGENGNDATNSFGAYLDNTHSLTKSSVTLTDSGFSFNRNDGLRVFSTGMITLKDVSASNNQNASYGAYLNNTYGTAGISLLNSPGHTNNFDGNSVSDAGLKIDTYGAVLMYWTNANNNSGGRGATIDNSGATNNVTILYGGFNQNGTYGIFVNTWGVISATFTDCGLNDNGSSAVYFLNNGGSATKAVTLDGGNYFNNGSTGIAIFSKGLVTVKNINLGDTQNSYGMYIYNNNSPTKAGITVTTTRAGWVNQFNRNKLDGLYLFSKGTITINNTSAEDNGETGAYVDNDIADAVGNVVITNSSFTRNGTGSANLFSGLYINSRGTVSLYTINANENDDASLIHDAVYIDNGTNAATPKPVSILNSEFARNASNGLYVNSRGAITVTGVYVGENGTGGAVIENSDAATPQPVTIKTSEFSSNGGQGLYIESKGAVTVTDANAHDNNNGNGMTIFNDGSGAKGDVKVTCTKGTCNFSNNNFQGVSIESLGNIVLSKIDAKNNFTGATLINVGLPDNNSKTVTISDCYFSDNTNSTKWGLRVQSKGAITLKNVDAGNNAGFGISLDNHLSPTNAGVIFTGRSDRSWVGNNGGYGMNIYSLGKVVVSKINASNNAQYGLGIDNDDEGAEKGSVIITDAEVSRNIVNDYTAPNYYSLNVISRGAITLTQVYVNGNGDRQDTDDDGDETMAVDGGAFLDNRSSTALVKPGITLTNVDCYDNFGEGSRYGDGLVALSYGNISIKNIGADNNSGYGAYLDNMYSGSTGTITLARTGTFTNQFNNNGNSGLYAQSNAAITVGYVNSNGNGNADGKDGVYLDNSGDDIASPITVSNSSIDNNGGSGLKIDGAKGAVILTNVNANGNAKNGIYIDNSALAGQNITFTKVQTMVNQEIGLYINNTKGNVILKDISSFANSGEGVHISTNSADAKFGNVTISGVNFVNSNADTGLFVSIQNYGSLNMSGVNAEKNGATGIWASVNHATNAGTITITQSYVNFNAQIGLGINARNSVLLNGIYALNNGTDGDGTTDYDGVLITQNNSGVTNTIQNCVLHGNTGSGLDIERNGSGTVITNTSYFGNNINNDGNERDAYLH